MYCVYILWNPKGILYKGYTDDVEKRLNQHNTNDGFRSFTKNKGPWEMIYQEEFALEKDAKEREKFFKTGKGREFLKEKLRRLSA